ncbi:MAG: hypothetical protein Q8M24_23965 [Pseudolabrys sp.]|nr:hypothetical protein [Pseudolabrys sp.]MDP2298506.1 hypothetical protein [Pseudolabrys sp.]
MMKFVTFAAVAAVALSLTLAPKPAEARDGQIAAGVVGGLAVGAIVGSQMNRNDDGYRYRNRNRAYARECHIERRDYEDRYGRLHVRKVRVCN